MPDIQFDQIGYWSEVKHEIIRKYARAYTTVLANQGQFHFGYIDAFSGMGLHTSRGAGEVVKGSPLNALDVSPAFKEFHFIDLDEAKTGHLENLVGARSDVHIHTGDCNSILMSNVFPSFLYRDYRRALCLLDPYGLHLDWTVMEFAGHEKSIEIFLNFPVMDMNRNTLWKNPDAVPVEARSRMTRFWGDESWIEASYSRDRNLFQFMEKESNEVVAEAFRKRLLDVAKFRFVPPPLPMKNSVGAIVYYLFFASFNKTGAEIVTDIFSNYS